MEALPWALPWHHRGRREAEGALDSATSAREAGLQVSNTGRIAASTFVGLPFELSRVTSIILAYGALNP